MRKRFSQSEKNMKRALLLNADYTPLHFISDTRAIMMLYKGRAEPVEINGKLSVWDGCSFNTPNTEFQVPATIRLIRRINKSWKPPRFRKKVLFNRDGWKCQYCKTELHWHDITIDHVQPKSRGGGTSWKNCVSSCRSCNRKKSNKTLAESGMSLIKQPLEPNPLHFWDMTKNSSWHDDWEMLIPQRYLFHVQQK